MSEGMIVILGPDVYICCYLISAAILSIGEKRANWLFLHISSVQHQIPGDVAHRKDLIFFLFLLKT